MASVLTRNLRLRVNSSLTADAKFNLERIDLLGGLISTNTVEAVSLRSRGDITIEPNSESIGGSGAGGALRIGTTEHSLAELNIYASSINFSSPISILDSSSAFYLNIAHNSGGSSTGNRSVIFNTRDANRTVDLSGNIVTQGNLATVGAFSLTLTTTADTDVTFPTAGLLATQNEPETWTNKSITGTFTGPLTGDVTGNLIGNINGDITGNLTGNSSGTHTGPVIGDVTGNVSGTASNITGVAAIANGGTGATSLPAALNALLPDQAGNGGKILLTDGTNANWIAAGGGSVTSVGLTAPAEFTVTGSPVTLSGVIGITKADQPANLIYAGPSSGADAQPTFRALTVDDIPGGADHSLLSNLAADDHTQYHTDGRADTWLGTKTTDDLVEGASLYLSTTNLGTFTADDLPVGTTNLYYTDALVDTNISTNWRGQADGLASLDNTGKVPTAQLPSYVDDVEEYVDLASFPVTGESAKIYVAIDTGKTYRWSGSVYTEISPSDVNSVNGQVGIIVLDTDDLMEGTNKFYTDTRVNSRIYGTFNSYNITWTTLDGVTLSVPHNLGTIHTHVSIVDIATGEVIFPDTIIQNGTSTDLAASAAPPGTSWSVRISRQ